MDLEYERLFQNINVLYIGLEAYLYTIHGYKCVER